mmetsp:Transcript_36110/g.44183  ORF Transcript_36110/g.44183 Transcript_36110/m.44183 type:complete len:128 (+) Transcript_36110:3-386(+)
MMHGVIAYVMYWAIHMATNNDYLSNFLAAATVTLSAGIISRLSGRQALGNSLSGLYVLVPGAYLIKSLFGAQNTGWIETMAMNCVVIGLGAWTGTLLCSPTILGTTSGLLQKSSAKRHMHKRGRMTF